MEAQTKRPRKAGRNMAETMRQLEAERERTLAEKNRAPALETAKNVPAPVSPEEQQRIAAWRKRYDERGVPVVKASASDRVRGVTLVTSEELFNASLAETMGFTDPSLAHKTLQDVVGTLVKYDGTTAADNFNIAVSAVKEIGPRDGVEGMLAAQMVATQNLVMRFLAKAAAAEDPDLSAKHIEQATKLQRTYLAQVEALNRHRGKGQQRVTVEHVHVHDGGQAIVGQVTQQSQPTGRAG